jgi:spore coat protein U-like protein
MLVRANVSYDISISSANEGNMAHTDPSDGSLVPYDLRIDAGSVDLSGGPVTVATGTGPTAGTGERYELELQVGDPGAASAGTYEDMLQVTVTAR